MFKPRILFFLLLPLLLCSAAEEKPCTTHADGKFYDLTPLKTSKDQKLKTFGGREISLNVCQTAKTETYGLKDDIKQDEVAAFVHGDHGSFVLGKVNTTLSIHASTPRLLISHGSRCKSETGEQTNTRASALIKFTCDTTVVGLGKPTLEAQLPVTEEESCAFVFEWKTPHACPARETGFLWNLFIFLAVSILIILMTYTILGTLYNRFILNLRGYDQIPQFSLSSMKYHASEVYDWSKDMLASYNIHLPSSFSSSRVGRREVNPVSHQAGVGGFRLGEEEDVEEGLGLRGGGGGFVRPQHPSRQQKGNINPVSHQSQVNSELAAAASSSLSHPNQNPTSNPSPPAPPPKSSTSSPSPPTQAPPLVQPQPHSALSNRAFALGDDEDGEGEELADVSSKPRPSTPSDSESESESESDAGENSHLTGNQASGRGGGGGQGGGAGNQSAAAMRGRELDGGGAIRL